MLSLFSSLDFEYMAAKDVLVARGDCLDILGRMEGGRADLIFADPPYNLGKDFGNASDSWRDRGAYFAWCRDWIDACFRVLKDGGVLYIMNSTQNMPYLSVYLQERYNVLNDIAWCYDSSGVQAKKKFGSAWEPIIMANRSAGLPYTFNRHDVAVEAKTGARRGLTDYRKTPPAPYASLKTPGNAWHFPRVRYKMPEYENHPSQKPEALLERIIRASSNPGDLVLDPFAGSFTTCAVARRLGRSAVGIDANETYYKIGLRRTGICHTYEGEILTADRGRKTRNKSKKDHL